MPYPRSANPNYGLDVANCFIASLGAPALADADQFVVSVAMANGAYTLAAGVHSDGLSRNLVATISAVTGNDTPGSILITGTGADGRALTETLALVAGSTATGLKCFKTVTSIVQSGWVINTGNDTIVIGEGDKIALPPAIRQKPQVAASTQVFMVVLGTALVAVSAGFDAADISKCWVDATAGTYDGSKKLYAFIYR